MYILGFSAFMSDSAACLIKDGKIIGAVEEERLNRAKHTGDFPKKSINYLLNFEGITIADVDHVVFFFKPLLHIERRLFQIASNLPNSLAFMGTHAGPWLKMLKIRQIFKQELGVKEEKYQFHNIEHHLCHMASSYYLSPFKKSAILTIDGSGELACTMVGYASDNNFEKIKEFYYPNSIGYLYAAITKYLGFKPNSDEGKVMGLAPYGKPKYIKIFRDMCQTMKDGDYKLNLDFFDFYKNAAYVNNEKQWVSKKFITRFGLPRDIKSEITQKQADIAASLQMRLNEVSLHLANFVYRETGSENLCLAGGVGLNSVMNGYILEKGPFKDIFIQPASGDAGTAIGAALYFYYNHLGKMRKIWNSPYIYLGPDFTNRQIKVELDKRLANYRLCNPPKTAARLIAEGKIVGWFQGKGEFGPRSLGNRSILADPRDPNMKDKLNARVKHREAFRPFAPSVLEEHSRNIFSSGKPSKVMLFVYDVLENKKRLVPAITHVDGTARVQTVAKKDNKNYFDLIEEFYRLTGIPLVLNTSFNDQNEPIVNTPQEALNCFYSTGIDALIIGNYLVLK